MYPSRETLHFERSLWAVLFGVLLAVGAGACVRGPEPVPSVPAWTGKHPLGWWDCDEGSTLVERRTQGDGREPFLVRRRQLRYDRAWEARVTNEWPSGLSTGFTVYWSPDRSLVKKPHERFLRRDRLVVEGKPVDVEVFERIENMNWGCCGVCPCMGTRQVEEVWRQVGAPPAQEPLRVRHDRNRSEDSEVCRLALSSSRRAPDADGFIDVRRVLRLGVGVVIDGQEHPCMEVRSWSGDDLPLDSLECPSVLGGMARWEQVYQTGNGQTRKDLIEVVSFDCRPRSRP
ncbi:hypothetical protein NR798_05710 [Archangium gephyra]|uniref:hypothetical protein n=1 Tax=Archangium gephyra TaxID=48 RepID=UPI0035D4C2A4